jgi:MFS family permease
MPARQSLVNQLVNVEDLPNAIALNSSMINAARIVGPGIAGVLVAQVGEGVCFMINAISYLVVIGALLAMNISRRMTGSIPQVSLTRSLAEGINYALAISPIRHLLLLMGLLKVSQYVTLTGQRKCHPFVPQSRRLKKISLIESSQIGGTLGSPRSEIVR